MLHTHCIGSQQLLPIRAANARCVSITTRKVIHRASNIAKAAHNEKIQRLQVSEERDANASSDARDISEAGSVAAVNAAEVDTDAYRAPWYRPAFTRRREIFMARAAMVGFLSLQVGEILTGEGLFGQVANLTTLPKPVVVIFLLGLVFNNVVAAAHPSSPTWSQENQQDLSKRKSLASVGITLPKPGFTKVNELNIGRFAMLGFGAATIGELFSGKGPAGQLGLHMDQPLVRAFGGIALIAWVGFWIFVAQRLGTEGQLKGDTEIY